MPSLLSIAVISLRCADGPNLDEFNRPLRADSFWGRGGTRGPCTALVSSTHAGRDSWTVKHEQYFPNGFYAAHVIVHIAMLYCISLCFWYDHHRRK